MNPAVFFSEKEIDGPNMKKSVEYAREYARGFLVQANIALNSTITPNVCRYVVPLIC